MTKPTRTCASHCRDCDRHFAGDGAFDRHRGGGFASDGKRKDTRHCKNPERDDWYEAVDGECRISSPGQPPMQITIWRQSGAAERLKGFDHGRAAVA